MKIVILDQQTYLPQHAISRLNELGEVVIYDDRPSTREAIYRLNNTDIAVIEWTTVNRDMFRQIKRLQYIVVPMTSFKIIDIGAAHERGVKVSNVPAYSDQSVAELGFGLLLALNRKLLQTDREARTGKRDLFHPFLGTELYGKTLGVLGLGHIGTRVAAIGQGFGMRILAHSRTPKGLNNVEEVSLEQLLRQSDALMVCVSRDKTTEGMLSGERLSLLKPTAFLVSLVGGICDEKAVASMLRTRRLAGAALDVVSKDSPLERLDNTVLTTCIGWYTQDSLERLVSILVGNIEAYISGRPRNLLSA